MQFFLFDFDGTLVDSMPTYGEVMLRILKEENLSYKDDILKTITPLGYVGTAKYYKQMGMKISESECIERMTEYARYEYENNIIAKNNVCDVLKKLKNDGASLNVLTASPHIALDPCLKRLGIFELFDNVWSCEDFKTTKSDLNIYKVAAEKIGTTVESVLFLDDNPGACKTAKQAGMKVCGVYDESSAEYEEEMKQIGDFYINDFSELLNIIK